MKRSQEKNERVRIGDFEIRNLTGGASDFDIGVDYLQCGNLELAKKLEAEAFAPCVCTSDVVVGDALVWGLVRA